MKKEAELRYPHSASLFRFCRKILDHKYDGVRVIDQDIGQILGFDPADCSHWKKGKKNIRSIHAMKSIAGHLGVDEHLVADVASGELSDVEAYWEVTGYGDFRIDHKRIESSKKEFIRENSDIWTRNKEKEFRDFFKIDRNKIIEKVNEIRECIGFEEAPLYLPEISVSYADLQLRPLVRWVDDEQTTPVKSFYEGSRLIISFKKGLELKPFVRFKIIKSMGEYFIPRRHMQSADMKMLENHVHDVESNIFASYMLAPADLIRKELRRVSQTGDLVHQLAETFWVSRAFINCRISEMMLGTERD